MGMTRVEVRRKGLDAWSKPGDGWLAYLPVPVADATDGDVTLTANQIKGGAIYLNGFTAAGHNLTTPIAADILAALPGMNVGDTYVVSVFNGAAFDATLVAGDADVTLAGLGVVNAGAREMVIEKTSATAVTITLV